MPILYNNELIHITNNDDIVTVLVQSDNYNEDIVEPVKNTFDRLFDEYSQKPMNKQFACIFNLSELSCYNIYCYAKEFKTYFKEHSDQLHASISASVIVTQRTFIRCIIRPLIRLINSGQTYAFKNTVEEAQTFLKTFREQRAQEQSETVDLPDIESECDELWAQPVSPTTATQLSTVGEPLDITNLEKTFGSNSTNSNFSDSKTTSPVDEIACSPAEVLQNDSSTINGVDDAPPSSPPPSSPPPSSKAAINCFKKVLNSSDSSDTSDTSDTSDSSESATVDI